MFDFLDISASTQHMKLSPQQPSTWSTSPRPLRWAAALLQYVVAVDKLIGEWWPRDDFEDEDMSAEMESREVLTGIISSVGTLWLG